MKKITTHNKLNESVFGLAGGGVDNTVGGASYMVQGKGPGYVYSILPFNDTLQQKTNKPCDDYYIYPGCKVRGVGVNNPDKHYTGIVNRIVKDSDGAIRFIYIKTLKTNRFVTIAADDNLELLLNTPKVDSTGTKFPERPFSPSHNIRI